MLRVATSYFFFFVTLGIMVPFLSPVLLSLGYSKADAGLIQSGLFICNILLPLLGGRISDRFLSADRVIRFCAYLMLVLAIALWFHQGKTGPLFVALILVFSAARSPLIPLQDSIAMEVTRTRPDLFSRLRMVGSIGFALAAIVAGYVFDRYGWATFFPVLTVACAAFAGIGLLLPREVKLVQPAEPYFWRHLNHTWWVWMLAMMLHWVALSPYHFGFTILLEEAGIATRASGWFWSIGVGSEIAFFFAAGWFFRRWSYRTLLFLGLWANLLRWILTGLFPHDWVIALCQLLHGPGFALFYAAAVQGIQIYCGGRSRASYQGLFSSCMAGVATVTGMALSGFLYQFMPFYRVMLAMAPIQFAAILVLAFNRLNPPHQDPVPQKAFLEAVKITNQD